jgi:glycosyltransferase involved in cell wall biosynthesis
MTTLPKPAALPAPTPPASILIITDAWHPQVNGVVRTIDTVTDELRRLGHPVEVIGPDGFLTMPCPTYPEIRLSLLPGRRLARLIDAAQPCAIHIATEGPLGLAARAHCLKRGLPFTTAYHTRFPEYVHARFRVPLRLTYGVMRWFHGPAAGTMVATRSIAADLEARGLTNTRAWSRGVDVELFHPKEAAEDDPYAGLARPIWLNVGRVAVEKNIEAFLALDLPGTKVVVGDGPARERLMRAWPGAHFAGARHGEDLARHFRAADVFVFPSRTDTFGLVLLEALASGLPVAAFPVPGPLDVLVPRAGIMDEDLGRAAHAALALDPADCRAHALGFSWAACARQFLANLEPLASGRSVLTEWQQNGHGAVTQLT